MLCGILRAPRGARSQWVQGSNPPGSGKDMAEGKEWIILKSLNPNIHEEYFI
jgi:hypothetical protein